MTPDQTPEDRGASPQGRSPPGGSLDDFSVFMPPRAARPGLATRHMLFVGVAAACVLGVGLGIWARPAMSERQVSVAAPAEVKPVARAHQLAIVVDDRPAPLGAPIEVLSGRTAQPLPATAALLATAPGEPLTQARPAPQSALKTSVRPAPTIDRFRVAAAKAAAHKAQLAVTARIAKAEKAEKVEHLRLAKAARQHQLELAKAEARGRAAARAEARAEATTIARAEARDDQRKRLRLASLVRAVQKVLPPAARSRAGKPHAAHVELAKTERKPGHKPDHRASRHEARIEQASLKTHKPPPRVTAPAYRAHAAPTTPPQRPSGLMKVSAPHCANRDRGEALVCADPSLGAADRQLARAYQSARAAGVPDAQLRQQQQRWLSARSSAAREAPWAVHDVYLARIAELNGQAREAHGDND